ncbi:HlyD family type I secretion periplasmic adaptor subunit, partial [Rhodopila sp.]|uniref:HlyD family type I secretion periplasmic adaptor subunit n=1 Tax=Rhodopila sp. TaxID=2480087 RepID=UPI002C0834CC
MNGETPSVMPAQRAFLPAVLEILETPPNPAGRAIMATIGAALLAAVAWAGLGKVDIIATADGTVIPVGKSKVVQPLESGVVRAIRVTDGDHVQAGQVLFELDETVAVAERDRIARDWRKARLDVAGLRALAAGLGDDAGPEGFVPPADVPAEEIAIERDAIAARAREQRQKGVSLRQQIAQKTAEVVENDATIAKLSAGLPILQQKRDLYRSLLDIAFTNKIAWLDAEQAWSDQAHQLAIQQAHGSETLATRAALWAALDQGRAEYAGGVLKDLAEAAQKAGELEQQYAAAAHKAEQTVLTAPISGTVQGLAMHTVGGVVTPAQALLTVVPDDAPVLIEAEIQNQDIGFVHAGQEVEVKVR